MEPILSRKQLVRVVQAMRTVVQRSPKLPILEHVLFEERDGGLAITGTDLVHSVTIALPNAIMLEGGPASFCIPLADLATASKGKSPAWGIHFYPDSAAAARLSAKFSEDRVIDSPGIVQPAEDFPHAAALPKLHAAPVGEFADCIRTVGFARSASASRPVLNSVFYNARMNELAATDGKCLAIRQFADCGLPQLLPDDSDKWETHCGRGGAEQCHGALFEPCKIFWNESFFPSGASGMAGYDDLHLHVACGDVTVTTRLTEGRFYNYRQVFADYYASGPGIVFDRKAVEALCELRKFALPKSECSQFGPAVRLSRMASDLSMVEAANVTDGSGDYGSPVPLLSARWTEASASGTYPKSIEFSWQYLLDTLDRYDHMHVYGCNSPAVFTSSKFGGLVALMPRLAGPKA